MFGWDRPMLEAIHQAKALLADPKSGDGLVGALFAAGFCAMAATLLAGAVIFGQLA